MADCMGVSFQALVIRLKTLGLLIPRDLTVNTSDEVRKELKEYAKTNGLDIYEMGIEQGKYSFIPKKIVLL